MQPSAESPRNRAVTMRDIARRCGVVQSTVSFALNHDARVRPETAERIRAVAREMGYNPALQDSARRLVQKRHGKPLLNHAIALFSPKRFYRAQYFSALFHGVQEALSERGFAVLTIAVDDPYAPDPASCIPPMFARGDIDGSIFAISQRIMEPIFDRLVEMYGAARHPVLSVIRRCADVPTVLTDDESGANQAVHHLLALGHRHILHFWAHEQQVHRRRLAGMARAVEEAGLEAQTHCYFAPWSLGPQTPGDHLTLEDDARWHRAVPLVSFLREHPAITAIFADNDPTARRIYYQLRNAGIRVPADISLVGFDDTDPILDSSGRNVLTTVRLPLMEVGNVAGQRMVAHVTGELPLDAEIMLSTSLIVRHSTAPRRA